MSTTATAAAPMAAQKVRPTGITILAVLNGILSVLILLGGIGMIVAAPFIGAFMPTMGMPFGGIAIGAFLGVVGVVLLIFGALGIVVTWGMWTGKAWAWWLAIIVSVIGVIGGLLSIPFGLGSLIINGAILYYLTRPHVKVYFGQKPVTVTMQV